MLSSNRRQIRPCFCSLLFQCILVVVVFVSTNPAFAVAFQLENNTDIVLDASAKLEETGDADYRPQLGQETVVKYQIGTTIQTKNGAASKIKIYMPVPNIWPEQSVTIENEKISDRAGKVKYKVFDRGFKQMEVSISKIPANTKEEVSITYRIAVKNQLPPKKTEGLIIPKKKDKAARLALGSSPGIDPKNRAIKKILKELYERDTPAWEKGKLIHKWVIENTTEGGRKPQNTSQILKSKQGRNEDRVALFIAMMRTAKIPCRLVVASNTGYAEFCLQSPGEKLIWYPCQIRGNGSYGELNRALVVFQKGDNIRVPWFKKGKRNRVIPEHVTLNANVQPVVRPFRRIVH